MTTKALRQVISQDPFRPIEVNMKAGVKFRVDRRAGIWIPDGYESTIGVSVPKLGIVLLTVDDIETVLLKDAPSE